MGDYRLPNTQTQPYRHPLPILGDLLQEVHGELFAIDLCKAFLQIPVADEDIENKPVSTRIKMIPGFSETHEEHFEHLNLLFAALHQAKF